MPGLIVFDSKLAKMKKGTRSLDVLRTYKVLERAAKFGSCNDRVVGVFLPQLNSQSVHFIQSFLPEEVQYKFLRSISNTFVHAKGNAIPNE